MGGLLQGKHQLAQILNRVDVVMGRRGNGVGALRDHSGLGHVPYDLCPGQVTADAGLGALAHFDFNGSTRLQVVLVDAEPAGSHLNDGVGPILVKVLMESALAGVVVNAQLLGRPGETLVGVVADGAVAHGGKHQGRGKFQLGRQIGDDVSLAVPANVRGLAAQKRLGLHGFPKGIDGGVGHLGRVDEYLIPVDGIGLGVAHGGEQHPAAVCLQIHFPNGLVGPVVVFLIGVVGLDDLQRPGGTQSDTPVAVDALAFVGKHLF